MLKEEAKRKRGITTKLWLPKYLDVIRVERPLCPTRMALE